MGQCSICSTPTNITNYSYKYNKIYCAPCFDKMVYSESYHKCPICQEQYKFKSIQYQHYCSNCIDNKILLYTTINKKLK